MKVQVEVANAREVRLSGDSGVAGSYFALEPVGEPGFDVSGCGLVAEEFLALNREPFGLDGIDLQPAGEVSDQGRTVCLYEQRHHGTPVRGAGFRVTVRQSDGAVLSAVSRVDHLLRVTELSEPVRISAAAALRIARRHLAHTHGQAVWSEPRLYIVEGIPSWIVLADTRHPASNLEIRVDARSGEVSGKFDRRRYLKGIPALLFQPDPVTAAGDASLNSATDPEILNRLLVEAELLNLSAKPGPNPLSSGKWIRIAEREEPPASMPGSEAFRFRYPDPRFLGVMAYHYLDRLSDWIAGLGIQGFHDRFRFPLEVDPAGANGTDNSHFVADVLGIPYISLGTGLVPDATDPGVAVHEFGHAAHFFLAGPALEPSPWEEGFNDFLACLFKDRYNPHGFDRANPFPWDNNPADAWDPARRCDSPIRFDDPGFRGLGMYGQGSVYGSALWELYLRSGGHSPDQGARLAAAGEMVRLCFGMLLAVGDNGPLEDLVRGLISTDLALTGGSRGDDIQSVFCDRGLDVFNPRSGTLS